MIDLISYLPRLPSAGETLIGGTFELGFGGKGANQAVAARRFGCDVALIGCLGRDVFGDMTVAHLADEGIDISAMQRTDSAASGVAPIWVEPDGTNRIACAAGSNDEIDAVAAAAAIERLRPTLVLGQFEIPQQATLAAFRAARRVGAQTILNPAPADDITPELLALTNWLVPNETEFAHLAQIDDPTKITDSALGDAASTLGPRLLVTLGRDGAALAAPDAAVRRIPSPVVDVTDTTGAGDAFIGAFAAGIGTGMAADRAAELAVAFASDTVTRRGTQRSLPSAEACAELLRKYA